MAFRSCFRSCRGLLWGFFLVSLGFGCERWRFSRVLEAAAAPLGVSFSQGLRYVRQRSTATARSAEKSILFGSIRFYAVLFYSMRFYVILCDSNRFYGILIDSIRCASISGKLHRRNMTPNSGDARLGRISFQPIRFASIRFDPNRF